MDDDALTCGACGSMLRRKPQKDEGIAGIRQGKPSSKPLVLQGRDSQGYEEKKIYGAADFGGTAETGRSLEERKNTVERNRRSDSARRNSQVDAGRPQSKRGIAPPPREGAYTIRAKNQGYKKIQKRGINWMKVGLSAAMVFILLLGAAFIYLKRVPSGQRLFIRLGGDGPAEAYWHVGEGYMEEGKVNAAVKAFEKADEKQREATTDKNKQDNIDGLLNLASAYEAAGKIEDGEEIYRYLIDQVVDAKNRKEPYSNLIRVLMETDRTPEAARVMQTAFENTGDEAFLRQRNQTLPGKPEVADTQLVAGRYTEYKNIPLVSPQGYDIYYAVEEGILPEEKDPIEEGSLYTEPIALHKSNAFRIRAVCVNGELISDQLVLNYTISLPLPAAPKAGLAPGTYDKKQRVRLRHEDMENVTIYYTIDGSRPDENSPLYTPGDAIELPSGLVTLRAIAVDQMGIKSNTMEVGYKIKAGKVIAQYNMEDTFEDFVLGKTLRDDFEKKFGAPKEAAEVTGSGDEPAMKLTYPWGYGVAELVNGKRVMTELYMTQDVLKAPRGTHIGMALEEVTQKFRDLGQVANSKGHRGIYSDEGAWAEVRPAGETKDGQKQMDQVLEYAVSSVDGRYWILEYQIKNNKVVAISHHFWKEEIR